MIQEFLDIYGTRAFYDACRFVHEVEMAIADNVRNGEDFLDKEMPGWYEKIDLSILKMTSAGSCICGQLWMGREMQPLLSENDSTRAGYYYATQFILNGHDIEYGFTVPEFEIKVGSPDSGYRRHTDLNSFMWEAMTIEWATRIQKRRANAGTIVDGI